MQNRHFYYYCKLSNIERGIFNIGESLAEREECYFGDDEFLNELAQSLQFEGGVKPLFVFIHGYMADVTPVNRVMSFVIAKDIFTGSDQIVLHLHWQGKLIYSSTQLQVSEVVGPLFGKLLSQLDEKLGGKATFNILVHSMGGFVLQHLLKEAKISNKINECIMAAPDVETEAFIQSDYFGIDPKKILVLTCKDDKTLALANFMNPYPRLGVSGHLLEEHSIPYHEISDFSEDDLLVGKIMKHRYFYTNQKIRTLIAEQLAKC
ncbi:MAG: alpha/beta hydrolase [Saprospiraceae bacterium]|nr:alpha/beta hydrolase [Saprospiraceae bacterium]